jgi:DnaJ-class molecular chaperone
MALQDAFALFRLLGVYPDMLSRFEFSEAYHRIAQRYHPDVNPAPAAGELMAIINAARTTILQTYRHPS